MLDVNIAKERCLSFHFSHQKHVLFFVFADHTYNWQKLPGNLTQIDNGLTDEVWGVHLYRRIFRWDEKTNQWETVPGSLKHVSAGKTM